jgi:hypothetical protein
MATFDYAEQQRIIDEMRKKEIFFVGGLPKSGSTWLQIMLHAHPEVSCSGEGHFLTYLAPRLGEAMKKYNSYVEYKNHVVLQDLAPFPQCQDRQFKFMLVSMILLLLAASGKARDVRVVGEKTPDKLDRLPLLIDLFPSAKLIHALRDPRDCAISAWFHNHRLNAKDAQAKYPTLNAFVAHCARAWMDVVRRWEHVAAVAPPGHCAMVRYEDLVAQPHAELSRLFEFLGVSTAPATVDACVKAGAFARLTGGRPPGVEDRGALLRRGVPGDWRNHFADADDLACRAIAGGAMARYGYVG